MTATILAIVLGVVNLLSRVAHLKCFDCGKKLRLRLVNRNGVKSIECSCCWKHQSEKH